MGSKSQKAKGERLLICRVAEFSLGCRPAKRCRMAETATLSQKFRISIPKSIRVAKHWTADLTFAFIPKGTGVLLVPVPQLEARVGLAKDVTDSLVGFRPWQKHEPQKDKLHGLNYAPLSHSSTKYS